MRLIAMASRDKIALAEMLETQNYSKDYLYNRKSSTDFCYIMLYMYTLSKRLSNGTAITYARRNGKSKNTLTIGLSLNSTPMEHFM